MTIAASVGWSPIANRTVCSLGWGVLEWTYANLPHLRDDSRPFTFTDEQARRVVLAYELDPLTGRRLYDRVHEEEAKGWGKGPFAAAIALAEFGGAPVLFCCWGTCGAGDAAPGQPHGKPWGSPGTLVPYVQVVAVSESQSFNVWQQVMILAAGARGDLARVITVDSGRPGRTMLRRRDIPAAEMARATASAASRTGAPVVHGVFDEVQLWLPENGGDDLAAVVMFNLDKTGGWGHFLGNAPVKGRGSVAETWGRNAPRVLTFATRPTEEPREDWPVERKRAALAEVYRDVPWIDIDRQVASLSVSDDGQGVVPWGKVLRDKFNVRTDADDEVTWMAPELWGACVGDAALVAAEPVYVCVRIGHQHRAAAVAAAQRQDERVVLVMWTDEVPEGEYIGADGIEARVRELRVFAAQVFAEVTGRPGGRTHTRRRPGPLLLHHEAFFEPSRQRLEREGMAMVAVPSSQERLTPAAETLMQAATSGTLVHDGNEETARQMSDIIARERPRGWAIESRTDGPLVAAQAAMLAVHWAMSAERPRSGPGRAAF